MGRLVFTPPKRSCSKLSAAHWARFDGAGFIADLGAPRLMSTFPWLTVLTLFPLVSGIVVLGLAAGQKRLARGMALGSSIITLGLVLFLWRLFQPASGDLQFPER